MSVSWTDEQSAPKTVATIDVTPLLDRMSSAFWRVCRVTEANGMPGLGVYVLDQTAKGLESAAALLERSFDYRKADRRV